MKKDSPKIPDSTPSLSNAEWEVMKPIWEKGPLPARDVYAALPEGHGWATNTVKTLLSRLVAKGALDYEQVGNTYVYRAALSRDQVTREEMKGFIQRVLDGSWAPVLSHFIRESEMSEEEINRLKRLLEEKERSLRSEHRKGEKP